MCKEKHFIREMSSLGSLLLLLLFFFFSFFLFFETEFLFLLVLRFILKITAHISPKAIGSIPIDRWIKSKHHCCYCWCCRCCCGTNCWKINWLLLNVNIHRQNVFILIESVIDCATLECVLLRSKTLGATFFFPYIYNTVFNKQL